MQWACALHQRDKCLRNGCISPLISVVEMVSAEEHEQVLSEEMEVLESIYIEELQSMLVVYAYTSELSPTHLQIRVVPEEYDEARQGMFV